MQVQRAKLNLRGDGLPQVSCRFDVEDLQDGVVVMFLSGEEHV